MLYDPKKEKHQVKIEPWRQILLDAADLLEKKQWLQCMFFLHDKDTGEIYAMCASQAIYMCADFDESKYQEALYQMEETVASVICWNDMEGQTKEHVVETMRKVAAS